MEEGKYKDEVSSQIIISSSYSGNIAEIVRRCPRDNDEIGMRRVNRIAKEYRERGFFVVAPNSRNKGVDLQVYDGALLVEVAECTNYKNKWEYIHNNEERLKRYITTLNEYSVLPNVRKRLYVSFLSNVENKRTPQELIDWLHSSNIEVVVCGEQD